MPLTAPQFTSLIDMIATAEPDDMDCDECFGQVAEYAEMKLSQQGVPEGMQAIERHLQQCPCCRDEYNALLEGMRALSE
jgi:predicted anti-sigma-YlaC factor YlaD